MKRLVRIKLASGIVKTYDMSVLTIDEISCIARDGGEVVEYLNE